jgi:uncharacterized protein with NRDE domain
MCLIALALEYSPRFPLVIAANRDEFLHRPAAPLAWWQAAPDAPPLLAGRDLQAGGTWMGLSAHGRVAMLTNVRGPQQRAAAAQSRGALVTAWLGTTQTSHDYWHDVAPSGHAPFNLLAGNLASAQWWWADGRARAPQPLGPGLFGLSNAALDTPWPKVQGLKSAMSAALVAATGAADLEARLFAALADRSPVPDDALPDTGVGLARERWLAPAFIRAPDAGYGTRCSTLLVVERDGDRTGARMVERQFDGEGRAVAQRAVTFERWPLAGGPLPAVRSETINAG